LRGPGGEIHRAPIIRVHEAVVPELGALIEIGNTRGHELQDLLSEGVGKACWLNGGNESAEIFQEGSGAPSVKETSDEVGQRRLVRLVRIGPTRHSIGLPGDLDDVLRQAVAIAPPPFSVHLAKGPGADQGLIDHVLVTTLGGEGALYHHLQFSVLAGPAVDRRSPIGGNLAERRDARAHILRPLGVVGGRG
jgi:uncharacterized membrane protein YqaE (UPF0057 family)